MQTLISLIAVLSVAVLGGAAAAQAADLGTSSAIAPDQIKKKVTPATTSPAATGAAKALNTSPGNEQALRDAAQPKVPASGSAAATVPQGSLQTHPLPETDFSGMRRTDGSSPPAGPFGSIDDHRPPIYPDARGTLNTSPRNEQALRDANQPDLPRGAVPGLSLPRTPAVPGGSAGTTSRENKAAAGGTAGLNNASALGNASAPGIGRGSGAIGERSLLENDLRQGRVLDPEVARTLEEIRPLEESKIRDPLSGANPNADPWQRPTTATPKTAPGSAKAAAGLRDGPQGKSSDTQEIAYGSDGSTNTTTYHSDGSTTVEHQPGRNSDPTDVGSTTVYDSEGRHLGTAYDDGDVEDRDPDQDIVGRDATGRPITRMHEQVIREQATQEKQRAMEQLRQRQAGTSPATQPNENAPQDVGWRGLAPARPVKASNEPRGPLVSPVNPDDAIVRVKEEGRRSPEEIKAMVTQPGDGSESAGGDGSGKRDPCRFARPGPDGQLPAGCGGGGGAGPN